MIKGALKLFLLFGVNQMEKRVDRALQAKALKAVLKGTKAARGIYLLLTLGIVSTLVMVLSLYGLLSFIYISPIQGVTVAPVNIQFFLLAITFLLAASVFFVTFRQKTWLKAIGFEKRFENLMGRPATRRHSTREAPKSPAPTRTLTRDELRQAIEVIVEKKVAEELAARRTPAAEASAQEERRRKVAAL